MRTRSVTIALGLALAAVPGPGRAAWSGSVGLVYSRYDSWSGPEHGLVPQLSLQGDLAASGMILDPRWFVWGASAGYHRITSTAEDVTSRSDVLTYNGSASVFDYAGSPMRLGLSASRTKGDAKTSFGDISSLVSVVTQSYGASVGIDLPRRPPVALNASRTDSVETQPDGTKSTRDIQRLSAGTRHGTSAFGYNLSYSGEWSEGTFANDNSKSHDLGLSAVVTIAPGVTNYLEQHLFLRLPTTTAVSNAQIETNSVRAGARIAHDKQLGSGTSYAYSRASFSAPGSEDRTSTVQSLSESVQYQTLGRWSWGSSVSASYGQQRLGPAEHVAASQTAGGSVTWRSADLAKSIAATTRSDDRTDATQGDRPAVVKEDSFSYQGTATGSVGVLEGSGPLAPVYSTGLDGMANWLLGATQVSAAYGVSFGVNTGAAEGWSFGQTASLSGSRTLSERLTASGLLSASASRAHSSVFGDTAARALTLNATAAWRRYRLQLDAGLTSGFAQGDKVVHGDGLFIPAGFDSQSVFASASLNVPIVRKLAAHVSARYRSSTSPDRADESGVAVIGGVAYTLGAFVFSADDQYELATLGSTSYRRNAFMFSAARSFGSW